MTTSNYKLIYKQVAPGRRAKAMVRNTSDENAPDVPSQAHGNARQKIETRVKDNGEIYDPEENQAQIAQALNLILDHLINGTTLTNSAELKEYLQTQEVAHTAYDEEGFANQLTLVQNLLSQMTV